MGNDPVVIFHLHLCREDSKEEQDEYLIINKPVENTIDPSFVDKMVSNEQLLSLMNFEYDENDTWKLYHLMYSRGNAIEKKNKVMMKQYESANYSRDWLKQTKYACWWCCHSFSTPPCFIPIKYENDVFVVFGNFCSYNCALSYNFDKEFNRWTEYAELIHLLYRKIYKTNQEISYAPDKTVIKTFGGDLTIDEYRNNFFTNDTTFDVVYPPVQSIIPYLEQTVTKSKNADKSFLDSKVQKNLLETQNQLKNIKSKQQLKLSNSMFA